MLNYLLVPFVGLPHFGFLRLFQWITFRAAGAAVSAILLTWIVGPGIMRRLRRMRLHQVIREGTPDAHQQKGRTPTMGGLIILGATLTSTLLWARLDNRYVLIAMISMAWMGAIGFWDDYLKLKQKLAGKKNTGLVPPPPCPTASPSGVGTTGQSGRARGRPPPRPVGLRCRTRWRLQARVTQTCRLEAKVRPVSFGWDS
ncbi:MAG TPA: hypothetical protein VLJ83_07435 [Gemmatimonadaceae bacterium]|nr:hypothetical protein [Gemmatimonadaceae bacterium]